MSVVEAPEQPEAGDQSPKDELMELVDLLNLLTKHVEFQQLCLRFTDASLSQIRQSLSALG